IKNTGASSTANLSTGLSGTDASQFSLMNDTCENKPLGGVSSCSVLVVFAPPSAGMKNATLTVGDGSKSVDVPVSGIAVGEGALSIVSGPTFSMVKLPGSTTAMVTVKNTGGAPVTGLQTGVSGPNAGDFALGPDGCAAHDLAAGTTCTLTITFSPSAVGTK